MATETLAEHKARKISEGRFCYVPTIEPKGYSIGIAIEGINGYYGTDYAPVDTMAKAEEWANGLNARRKLSEEDKVAIIASTMGNNGRKR